MASVVISGDTSGTATLQAQAIAGNTVLTLPTTNGTLITTASGQTLTSPTITGAVMSSMASSVITSGTAQNTTSGTSIDFTGIPSWVKRITVMFSGVSTNGSSQIIIQIGNSSPETSGYSGTGAGVTSSNITSTGGGITSGFTIDSNAQASAASTRNGIATIALLTGSTYAFNSVVSGNNYVSMLGYSKTTSTVIDRIRITTVNGTDTFDAGSINILYE